MGGITTYSWTYENQMSSIEEPLGDLVTYTYAPVTKDADEFRVETESPSAITRHFWDRHNIVWETDDVGTVEAEYTLAPQEYGDLVSQKRDTESSFYHFDALGSTSALSDDSETVTDSYFYKAFGEILASTGSTANPFQWVGQLGYYSDSSRSLYSLRSREYSSQSARFLSDDQSNTEQNQNRYAYAANNPAHNTEPAGRNDDYVPLKDRDPVVEHDGVERRLNQLRLRNVRRGAGPLLKLGRICAAPPQRVP